MNEAACDAYRVTTDNVRCILCRRQPWEHDHEFRAGVRQPWPALIVDTWERWGRISAARAAALRAVIKDG